MVSNRMRRSPYPLFPILPTTMMSGRVRATMLPMRMPHEINNQQNPLSRLQPLHQALRRQGRILEVVEAQIHDRKVEIVEVRSTDGWRGLLAAEQVAMRGGHLRRGEALARGSGVVLVHHVLGDVDAAELGGVGCQCLWSRVSFSIRSSLGLAALGVRTLDAIPGPQA